jgi:photosystem II stability/assembly factor-like uncharacterized protein
MGLSVNRLMKQKLYAVFAKTIVGLGLLASFNASAQTSTFTYQGRLSDNGTAANGTYDLQFKLYDDANSGGQVGATLNNPVTSVSNGLFTVQLDFGSSVFNGTARWLEMGVRTNGSISAYTILSPRQAITSSPYAVQATSAATAATAASVPAANISGTIPTSKLATNVALLDGNAQFNGVLSGNLVAGNGALLTNLNLAAMSMPGTFGLVCAGFTPLYNITAFPGYPRTIVLADVNNDGRVDLISGHYGLNVALNNGTGLGGFSSYGGSGPTCIVVTDVNNDGKPDIVYGDSSTFMTATVLTNNGNGTFSFSWQTSSNIGNSVSQTIAVGDMNGDGKPDIIAPNRSNFTTSILTNDGTGTFQYWTNIQPSAVGASDIYNLTAGDLNGDGKSDLVIAMNDRLVVLTNSANGLIPCYTNLTAGSCPSVLIRDINADGKMDILAAGSSIWIFSNNGNGSFTISQTIGGAGVVDTGAMSMGDLNHDGSIDLAVADAVSSVKLYTNNGTGTFASFATVTAGGTQTRGSAIGDINNDGWNEVIGANLVGADMNVFGPIRAVNGTFTGNGAGLSSLNAASLITGTVSDSRLSGNVALLGNNQAFTGINTMNNSGNSFAGSFSGNGGGLTNLNLAVNGSSITNLNASALTTGTLADARLSANVPLLNATEQFTGAITATNSANIIAGTIRGDGSGLTNLNTANLTSGTVADARLSANVALLNRTQTFTGTNTFSSASNSFTGTFTGPGAFRWQVVAGTSQNAQSGFGYLVTNASLVTVTMPSSPNVGDVFRVVGTGVGGWKIAQNANQSVLSANLNNTFASIWAPQNSGNRQWRSIASSADGIKLVAVADLVYTSSDAGATWVPRTNGMASNGALNWNAVASSADGTRLIALGNYTMIYISTDSGATWTGRYASNPWATVACSSNGLNIVVSGNFGSPIYSSDGGTNWNNSSGLGGAYSLASSADGTRLVASTGSSSQLYTSTDSGANWTQQSSGTAYWTFVASSADGKKLVAAITGGGIYTSSDYGTNWVAQNSGNHPWYGLASSGDGTKLVAVGNLDQIFVSTDSGVTWSTRETARNWTCVTCTPDGNKLMAAVNSGAIYISSPVSTPGTAGYLLGPQNTAVELQYIGNNQFLPISVTGTVTAY